MVAPTAITDGAEAGEEITRGLEFRRVLFRSDRKSTRLNSSHLVISYAVFCLLFRSDRKSTRLNSSHLVISYAVFCLKKNCWAVPGGGWAILLLKTAQRPGPRMVNKRRMRGMENCTSHAATGRKFASWQRLWVSLMLCGGRPTGAECGSLLRSAPFHPSGKRRLMETARIRCFPGGIHHRLRAAVTGRQMASTSFSRRASRRRQ